MIFLPNISTHSTHKYWITLQVNVSWEEQEQEQGEEEEEQKLKQLRLKEELKKLWDEEDIVSLTCLYFAQVLVYECYNKENFPILKGLWDV